MPKGFPGHAQSRRDLRAALDRMQRFNNKLVDDPRWSSINSTSKASTSSRRPAQAAFDINREDDKVAIVTDEMTWAALPARAPPGRGWCVVGDRELGRMGRPHGLFESYKGDRLQRFDQGSLHSSMICTSAVCSRTPLSSCSANLAAQVNKDGGRDHWPHAMSVLMAGAGIPAVRLWARQTRRLSRLQSVYRPEDFAASLYTKMGIDQTDPLHDDRAASASR